MEEYLSLIDNPTIRRTFSQYRVSNHKLQIERGRYENVSREQRFCKLCNTGEVENEYHLALSCPKYEELRNNSNNILKNLFYLNNTIEGKQKLFEHAMSSKTIQFLLTCFLNISFYAFWREIKASNPWKIRDNNYRLQKSLR